MRRRQAGAFTKVQRGAIEASIGSSAELGVTDAVPETIEASRQLSEAVLVDIGIPMGHVIASIHAKRDEYRKVLRPKAAAAKLREVELEASMMTFGRILGLLQR